MNRLATETALFVAVLFVEGCGTPSQYVRTSAAPGEIVWAFESTAKRGLMATRHSPGAAQVLASEGEHWSGLPAAVACVPEARASATRARRHASWVMPLAVSGLGVFLGAAGGGSAMAYLGARDGNDRLFGGGLGVLFGGMAVGLAAVIVGADLSLRARAESVDAVNMYNDKFSQAGGCRPTRANSSVGRGLQTPMKFQWHVFSTINE